MTRGGYSVPCQRIEIIKGAHPVPDETSLKAAQRILQSVHGLTADDLVLAVMSGGASALLTLPMEGLTLKDKQALNRALLTSGAAIGEMNCVRRHLSAIKGGRLAAASAPAKVVTLLISDVPGDDPTDIGSGPTVGDPTTCADALGILERYRIELGPQVRDALTSGRGESVKPSDPRLRGFETHLIATPQMALEAAAAVARAQGVRAHHPERSPRGEARDVGKVFAGIAQQIAARMASRWSRPACCFRAAKPPSPCAARAAAGATSSSCSRWPWRSTGIRVCTPSPATPMVSMVPRTLPGLTWHPTAWNAHVRKASTRATVSNATTAMASSRHWATP